MPRAPASPMQLYGGMTDRAVAPADDDFSKLVASTRGDMAGAPVSQLRHPVSYQQRVIRCWEAYATDPLFRKLIDRVVDMVANGFTWEVQGEESNGPQSWLDRLENWITHKESKIDREEDVWNAWSEEINLDVPNTPQGLIHVIRWAARHLLLSGMFVPHWEYGTFKFGKQLFRFPMQLTCYPSSAITLNRTASLFMEEQVLLMMPKGQHMTENIPIEAPQIGMASDNLRPLPLIGESDDTEAFCLKYNWSPGDLTTTRIGQYVQTTWGTYPSPPFVTLLPQFSLRQKLFAADNALTDGIMNFIKVYKIGDKDHPPRPAKKNAAGAILEPGTIAQIKELIESGQAGPAMSLYLPYYVELEIKMPDAQVLMNEEKYVASTLEIMQAFGIITSRTAAGRNEKMERLNTAGFEDMLTGIRQHIGAFLQRMARRTLELNRGLTQLPTWVPNPLNTKSEEFIKEIHELMKVGRVSSKTLLRYHQMDEQVEKRRIAQDLATDSDDMFDLNVPTSFIQQTVQQDVGQPGTQEVPNVNPDPTKQPPGRPGKTTALPPTMQRGRPKGGAKPKSGKSKSAN